MNRNSHSETSSSALFQSAANGCMLRMQSGMQRSRRYAPECLLRRMDSCCLLPTHALSLVQLRDDDRLRCAHLQRRT